jgi:hypothetical protein
MNNFEKELGDQSKLSKWEFWRLLSMNFLSWTIFNKHDIGVLEAGIAIT